MWDPSDHRLKSYGQKFICGHNFQSSDPIDPKFWVWKKSARFSACLLNQFCPGVNSQGLYLVSLNLAGRVKHFWSSWYLFSFPRNRNVAFFFKVKMLKEVLKTFLKKKKKLLRSTHHCNAHSGKGWKGKKRHPNLRLPWERAHSELHIEPPLNMSSPSPQNPFRASLLQTWARGWP